MTPKHIFSYYSGNIKASQPLGTTTLGGLIVDISRPDQKTINLVEQIRNETDADKKSQLKCSLKSYTPSIVCKERRKYANIVSYSGLMTLDFDKLPSKDYAVDVRSFLFEQFDWVYTTWLSASGLGVRAIMHIDTPDSTDDFKHMFDAVKHKYIEEYEIIDFFDNAPKNMVLPLFQSHDPNMKYRKTANKFTERYIKYTPPANTTPPLQAPDDRDTQSVVNMTRAAIDKINDNGHPQLRGASFALGGYVGGGYIDHSQAVQLIDSLIETNSYLSQKQQVYKKTAREMIQSGTKKPIYL
jgi:hypothetical protein